MGFVLKKNYSIALVYLLQEILMDFIYYIRIIFRLTCVAEVKISYLGIS